MMKSLKVRACLLTTISIACLLTTVSLVMGQTGTANPALSVDANPNAWKRFVSAEGRFTAVFPGAPRVADETIGSPPLTFVVHKTQLTSLAEYGVIYSDYPRAFIEQTSPDVILDQGAKGAVAEVNSQLLSVSSITVNGYPARLLKERMPNGTIMHAKMVLVGRRLYQAAITTPKEDGASRETLSIYKAIAERFLNSFEIINTSLPPATVLSDDGSCPPNVSNCLGIGTEDLKARAISVPFPAYPPIARAAQASGTVEVAVVVDEEGVVISAQAITGHPLLQAAAVSAARNARFTPVVVDNRTVKVAGIIKYDFVLE